MDVPQTQFVLLSSFMWVVPCFSFAYYGWQSAALTCLAQLVLYFVLLRSSSSPSSSTTTTTTTTTSANSQKKSSSVSPEALEMARRARQASRGLIQLSTSQRAEMLREIARSLQKPSNEEKIFKYNKEDLERAIANKINQQLIKRLKITKNKIDTLVSGILQLADAEDPIDHVLYERELAPQLHLKKVETSLGVLMIIFESRPDILPQIVSLAVKTGNAVILKGGKEAVRTNTALHDIICSAISSIGARGTSGIAANAGIAANGGVEGRNLVQLVETRENVEEFLSLSKSEIDLIIPRGSNKLVEFIESHTSIPVLGHSHGLCHIYVHAEASIKKAVRIVVDAKTDYPAACNSVETILIDVGMPIEGVEEIVKQLEANGVKVFAGSQVKRNGMERYKKLFESCDECESFSMEYNDLMVTIEIVDGVKEAIEHINEYGSGHTDCIVTESESIAKVFEKGVDTACVFWNASTRFNDGYRFGLGAEVGISTNRIHARGPVGMKGLLTTKFVLESLDEKEGSIVSEFSQGKRKFTHKMM